MSFEVLRSGREAGKGKRPPVGWVNAVEPGSGRAGDMRIYYPCVIADRRTVLGDFCFRFFKSVLSLILVPRRVASAAGSEAGMDCGTALAKQARLRPCGEALRRRVFARPRAPASAAEGRLGEKSGSQCFGSESGQPIDKPRFWARKWIWISFSPAWISFSLGLDFLQPGLEFLQPGLEFVPGGQGGPTQAPPFGPGGSEATASRMASGPRDRPAWGSRSQRFGGSERFARKPLNSPDLRKKEAWISFPLALIFLSNDLDFPSPGFENPSTHFGKYSHFTWNSPAAPPINRAPRGRRGPLSPRRRRPPS